MRGKSIFKEEPLDTNFFRNFFEQQQLFCRVAMHFSVSFIQLLEKDFLRNEDSIFFWSELFCCQQKTLLGINSFQRVYSCSWTTDFLASGNQFFLHFSETPASDNPWKPFSLVQRFLLLMEASMKLVEFNFSRKIIFELMWVIFWLVETISDWIFSTIF